MIVFDTLSAILILYFFIYCIYRLFFFIKAKNINKYFDIHERTRSIVTETRRLCVLIYATNKDKNLGKLLGVLNGQTYDKEHYEVHVAYQKDENDPILSRDYAQGAIVHNIENPDYFTKDKALNLLIQKLSAENKFDAYVFLGANRMVGEKYLENINKTISGSCVLVGSKVSVNDKNKFSKRVKNAIISSYLKYTDRTSNIVRSMFCLPSFIDGENLIMTADVLEKTGYVNIGNKTAELEYSLELASNNIVPVYSPYIITAVNVKNYDFSSPGLKDKLALYSRYFPLLAFKNFSFREFILFLLKPDSLFTALGYLFLLIVMFYAPNHIVRSAVIALGVFLVLNFVISVNVIGMKCVEIMWLMFYPFCLGWQRIKILINNLTMLSIKNSEYEEENINSATINAVVNNGKKDFTCKLDLVSEDGMRKVIYREGNRFIATDSFLRMHDALEDITYKLAAKKLVLKTCQNCKHFLLQPDGTLDCLNGKCKVSNNEILIWNGCQYFDLHPDKIYKGL